MFVTGRTNATFLFGICKAFLELNGKNTNQLKLSQIFKRNFIKEDKECLLSICQLSFVIREIKIKTKHVAVILSVGQDVINLESHVLSLRKKEYCHFRKYFDHFIKVIYIPTI